MKIPLQRPYFDDREEKAVVQVLRSGWVTQGPKVAEFENEVAEFVGAKYAVATTSCTTALFLSLHMLGIGSEDEVIVPSLSFIATTNVIVHVGAKPVFVDINPSTYNIDPVKVTEAITTKTKAIVVADQVGLPCDLDKLHKIAKGHKLFVVEDAACALGSVYKGRRIGSINKLTCFSFHPRKLVSTGDGGMITTNDIKLAERARLLRHQGMLVSDVERHLTTRVGYTKFPVVGYNFRMSDIQAAVGVEQMKKLPRILEKRAYLARRYTKGLSQGRNIILPHAPGGYIHNWQSYIIRLRRNRIITRNNLMQKLRGVGISTQIGIMASHLEKPYKRMYPRLSLPETESAARETIALPLYFQMTKKKQDYVIEKVLEFTER